ncbi:Pol polyprotein [Vitis vinifera]|uniref:Pol polyprotein n=1 Tax=Vitis vinifera TaxID=29760 RepID=A0A438E6M5_VITVI|nr:Pol polyprotein [Vitis vinifera]
MDIVGPLPAAPAQKKFLLVATDYFSKWVEAEAYASIKDKDVTKFVWKNIVYRFGIPHTIITDNGPQFDSIAFQNFYSELNIRNSYSTSRYPQSNGQAEATNKTLITALKKRLETEAAKQDDANAELERNLDWADEVKESTAIRMADYQQRASAHYNRKVRPRSFKNGMLVLRKVLKILPKQEQGNFKPTGKDPI